MADTLKEQYTFKYPTQIASQIKKVYPDFKDQLFLQQVAIDYDSFELLPKTKHIALTLYKFFPKDYSQTINILVDSMGDKLIDDRSFGIESFLYMPYSYYILLYGLDNYELSIHAQYELTQRFTAEFCIRAFIEKYEDKILDLFISWTQDDSMHVRRLVSEGTRPRLPWSNQLKKYIKDPSSILPLLEALKDDKELYVRRSVANNLNDITKDNPQIVLDLCKKWLKDADNNRIWLINHALRTLIKKGDKQALSILGFNDSQEINIKEISITPIEPSIGEFVNISVVLENINNDTKNCLVDFSIDYVKANKKSSKKVFKLKSFTLGSNKTIQLSKKVSLKEMTTRKHYPGLHKVFLHINGDEAEIGSFKLNI